ETQSRAGPGNVASPQGEARQTGIATCVRHARRRRGRNREVAASALRADRAGLGCFVPGASPAPALRLRRRSFAFETRRRRGRNREVAASALRADRAGLGCFIPGASPAPALRLRRRSFAFETHGGGTVAGFGLRLNGSHVPRGTLYCPAMSRVMLPRVVRSPAR